MNNDHLLLAAASSGPALELLDWLMIALYFGILLGVAWWVVRRNKDTAADYFLAGRNLGWWLVGASIFASNIGSEHIVGLAGSGATDGVAMAHFELHAWCLLVLAWVFVPFYARSMVFTMPEFLERRFSPGSRYVLSVVTLVTFIVSKMAVGIYAGGVVFRTLLPEMGLNIAGLSLDSFWLGSILVLVLTGLYTALGGMRAVAYNDSVQAIILILGSALLTTYGLVELGGWTRLREICGSDMFNLWKPLVPPGVEGTWEPVKEPGRMAWYFNGYFPWLGMLFCAPMGGLWYWCTDQYIVQRALGAANQTMARRGSICAGVLKLLPVYLFIVPGLVCFALAKSGQSPALHDALFRNGAIGQEQAQAAFPLMVQHLLPPGLRGIVVAGLLSALMSSLAGVFNASATLFTVDLYEKWKPKATQHELVRMGRIATGVMVLVAMAWLPVIENARGLYYYLQAVSSYLFPPMFVVFFFGVFSKRLNGKGCVAAMVVGFILGIFRMAVDTPVTLGMFGYDESGAAVGYPQGSFLWIVNNIYFQYFSLLIAFVSAATMIAVSYATEKPDFDRIRGLVIGTASAEERRITRESWDWRDVAASVFILLCILGGYLYFTG